MQPYTYTELGEYNYKFVTDQGNEYSIVFSKYWQQDIVDLYGQMDIDIYEFYFEVVSRNATGMDKRIPHTIFCILESFLIQNKSVVFYITQREDGRGRELFKVYQFWHALYQKMHGGQGVIDKTDRVVKYGTVTEAHLSCLYLTDTFSYDVQLDRVIDIVLAEIYPNAYISAAI